MRATLGILSAALVMALAFSATAQDKKKAAPKVGNVIELEETVIEGRVQKPEAFYILQRSTLNYDALEPKKSFIPRILESAKADPF